MSRIRTQFGMVPDWVDEQVTDGTAMRVYVRLVRKYADAGRHAFPEVETLAEDLGVSPSSVKRALDKLRAIGAIQVTRSRLGDGSYGRNIYALPMDQPTQGSNMTSGPGVKYDPWVPPAQTGGSRRSDPGVKYDPSENQPDPVKPDPSLGSRNSAPQRSDDLVLQEPPAGKVRKTRARKPETTTPDEFPLDLSRRGWFKDQGLEQLGVKISFETAQFLDHHRAKGSRFRDWDAAWKTWMRNAGRFAIERRSKGGGDEPWRRHSEQ